jgi:transmembrane sensor
LAVIYRYMNEEQFQDLLKKYGLGECSEEEKALLESWYIDHARRDGSVMLPSERQVEAGWEKVIELSGLARRRPVVSIRRWSVAAAVLLLAGAGGYWYMHSRSSAVAPAVVADISAGGDRAILTLADGKTVALTGAANGIIANQGHIQVTKTADGQLVYQASGLGAGEDGVSMNSVTTPRGGQYHLILSDGSKVLLNAASSIQYPVAFAGNERRVVVTGEAYFEVAPDKSKPFHVEAGGQTIDVLGTSFDVNVYADEPDQRTTLLTGSVRVSGSGRQVVLAPGEQAVSEAGGSVTVTNKADLDDVMAWAHGDFVFDNEDITSIMRKIARWYDVDISYPQGSPGPMQFDGIVSRSKNISAVLQIMEATGKVNFKIEKRRVMVIAK